ncbi:MAG: AAA family ATPase [Deltaproteobacteria bacterium]|nr:AAA family ATPase [Deltaproteobacteria bacterium]
MTCSIGFAGKGGTGKTTLAGLLVKYLVEKKMIPVLAVDADSNSNLNEVMGLEVQGTLGDAREQMKKDVSIGMTKDIFMDMKVQEAIIESKGFDLVVMGRPEGAGCYCAANTLLTACLEKLIDNYRYAVIDNEAGMEHISRLTTNNIDFLIAVSDPTRRGIQAASRIVELTGELGLNIDRKLLIVNQTKEGQEQAIIQAVEDYQLDFIGTVPEDPEIQDFDLNGRPTVELGKDSKALVAAYEIFDKIF